MFDQTFNDKEIKEVVNTCGFQKLSDKQKRIIVASLLLERRYSSESNKARPKEYELTGELHSNMNCHLSVYIVEKNKFLGYLSNEDIQVNFFSANYNNERFRSEDQVNEYSQKLQFPSVVHISSQPSNPASHDPVLHTFLALDFKNNELVAWEKDGYEGSFRVVTAKQLVETYPNKYWGFRPLGEIPHQTIDADTNLCPQAPHTSLLGYITNKMVQALQRFN